ncbi:MAG: DUF6075 family protein [Lachnospiraceae bacterium]
MNVAANYEIIQEPTLFTVDIASDDPPNEVKKLFTAYGCVLLEEWVGKSYLYQAVNLKSGKSIKICRRVYPLKPSSYELIAEKIRTSKIAGQGRFEIDMPPGQQLSYEKTIEILHHVFYNILPTHGYAIRRGQVELAEHILESMSKRNVTLSEAGVGIGKTHAYIIAAAIIKRGRINDFWLRGSYDDMNYAESTNMPIIITTSSIALQKAIVREYIPEISKILMAHGIIRQPLTCIMRKGREHYICEKKLLILIKDTKELKRRAFLEEILKNPNVVDMGNIGGLTPYLKKRIGVNKRCENHCPYYQSCRYMKFMERAQSRSYDFQVCNHNYLLADVLKRHNGTRPLIPRYQGIIIDEAHKFMQAARQMYGMVLDIDEIPRLATIACNLSSNSKYNTIQIKQLTNQMIGQNERLFEQIKQSDGYSYEVINEQAVRHLRNINAIAEEIRQELFGKIGTVEHKDKYRQLNFALEEIQDKANLLEHHQEYICWLESGEKEILSAVPKNLDEMLYQDLWIMNIPIVLTSATLSAGGDFDHVKKKMGLEHVPKTQLTEITKPSPYNYKDNVLLYISEITPFPDKHDKEYLKSITEEIEKLITATCGHATVLFTSYNAMGYVFSQLKQRDFSFPLFRLDKSDTTTISKFKESKNGVIFASGSMWEGVDIPGDMLSLLVIVKLPFDAPDAISDYEQTLYRNMQEYKRHVIVPEMLVKLMQGFGRLIRLESDTGVVAILDSRVQNGGSYRKKVLDALPECNITSDIQGVQAFIKEKKNMKYFYGGDTMQFKDNAHKDFYHTALKRSRRNDTYHKALFYLLGLMPETRNHLDDIYDFNEHAIYFDCFNKGWQTSGTLRIVRLAFNLFNGFCGFDNNIEPSELYSPYNLFDSVYIDFFFEAIKLRYPKFDSAA